MTVPQMTPYHDQPPWLMGQSIHGQRHWLAALALLTHSPSEDRVLPEVWWGQHASITPPRQVHASESLLQAPAREEKAQQSLMQGPPSRAPRPFLTCGLIWGRRVGRKPRLQVHLCLEPPGYPSYRHHLNSPFPLQTPARALGFSLLPATQARTHPLGESSLLLLIPPGSLLHLPRLCCSSPFPVTSCHLSSSFSMTTALVS